MGWKGNKNNQVYLAAKHSDISPHELANQICTFKCFVRLHYNNNSAVHPTHSHEHLFSSLQSWHHQPENRRSVFCSQTRFRVKINGSSSGGWQDAVIGRRWASAVISGSQENFPWRGLNLTFDLIGTAKIPAGPEYPWGQSLASEYSWWPHGVGQRWEVRGNEALTQTYQTLRGVSHVRCVTDGSWSENAVVETPWSDQSRPDADHRI